MTEDKAKAWTGVWAFKAAIEIVDAFPGETIPKEQLLEVLRMRRDVAQWALENAVKEGGTNGQAD